MDDNTQVATRTVCRRATDESAVV